MPRPAGAIPHLPALDGLRGLAVLGVLGFHAGDFLVGGYLGVDLFFVLSGFLITSILLAEYRATERIDLRAFWIRRARRLLPAVVLLIVAVAGYARFVASPADRARIRWDGLATLGYVANWRAVFAHRSYWDLFAAPSPLEHTWSLAIEEQFYVVWPLLVAAVLAFGKRGARSLLAVSLVLAAISAALMLHFFDPGATTRAYLGTDTRGAAILVGAALAAALAPLDEDASTKAAPVWLDAIGLVAAAGLALAWARLDGREPFLYRGGFWLTEFAGLALIACAVCGRGLVARALSFAPLRSVGLISYGVYLWHWPIFVWLSEERTHLHGVGLASLRFAATFAVAIASYRFVEHPIRRHGLRNALVIAPFSAILTIAALWLGTAPRAGEPAEARPAEPRPEPQRRVLPAASELPKGTLRVLVVGDSVAVALGERMRTFQSHAFVAERGIGDCSLLEGVVPMRSLNGRPHDGGNCAQHWEADAAELQPDVTLVVLGGGFFAPAEIEGEWRHPCDPKWHEAYESALISRLRALGPNGGRRVVVRVAHPVGGWKSPVVDAHVDCFLTALDRAVAAVPGVTALDLDGKLCPDGACAMTDGGLPIRPDGLHFDGKGAESIARWVEAELVATSPPK